MTGSQVGFGYFVGGVVEALGDVLAPVPAINWLDELVAGIHNLVYPAEAMSTNIYRCSCHLKSAS